MYCLEVLLGETKNGGGKPALRLAFIRQLPVYVSVFVAPSLLFFAMTGALQTFRIPDQKTAPVLIQKLARVHKDDVFAEKPQRPKKPEQAGSHEKAKPFEAKPAPPPEPRSTTLLKWFFTAGSFGVAVTTLLGLWMALVHNRRKAAGLACPDGRRGGVGADPGALDPSSVLEELNDAILRSFGRSIGLQVQC